MDANIPIQNRFHQLFNQIDDAIIEFEIKNGEPYILDVNDTFSEVFGYNSEEISGKPLNDYIVPITKKPDTDQIIQHEPHGLASTNFVEGVTTEGNKTFVYEGASCNDDHGFAIYSEISDELRRERHLNILQRVLRHNLRNDLNVIIGRSERIIENSEDTQAMQDASTVKKAASRLSRLGDEAKIVQKVLGEEEELEPINASKIVNRVVKDCQAQFKENEIEVDIPEQVPIRADKRIQLAFQNLIDNAIRHNNKNPPKVEIEIVEYNEDTIKLAISDNGPGIPDIEKQIITDSKKIGPLNHGSGIGMWITKWAIEMCDGSIEIETENKEGSTIKIELNRPRKPV